MFGVAQQVGEAACIEDRLGSAVRADRIHRMGGVAQKGDAAVAPARQRVAIAHRIFPELVGRLDHGAGIDIGDAEALQMRHQILETAGPRPVLLLRQLRSIRRRRGRPQPNWSAACRARSFRDRINDEFCREAAGHDHRAAGQVRPASRSRRARASRRSSSAGPRWGTVCRARPSGCRRRRSTRRRGRFVDVCRRGRRNRR